MTSFMQREGIEGERLCFKAVVEMTIELLYYMINIKLIVRDLYAIF